MTVARNSRTFDRLKKMIIKGYYDKEELLLDMTDFLEIGTLTEREFSDLLELIEQYPPVETYGVRIGIDESGYIISDSTFLLLYKQIERQVYEAEVVEQIATDFRITGAITRDQFKELVSAIDEIYYPVYEDEYYEDVYESDIPLDAHILREDEVDEIIEKATKNQKKKRK